MALTSARGPLMVLDLLGEQPASTSELYGRAGYLRLMRARLIPYAAFREALAELVAEGLAAYQQAEDGSTLWRRTERGSEIVRRRAASG